MKRKTYVKPLLNSEEFVPQEYVAACWIVECDVPLGKGYFETNGKPGCQTSSTRHRAADQLVIPKDVTTHNVRGCGTEHVGVHSDAMPEFNCYWVEEDAWRKPKSYNCFYWYQEVGGGHYPYHFSTLKKKPITNPNAS